MRRLFGSTLTVGAIGIAIASFALTGVSQATTDDDVFTKITQVNVASTAITCNFAHAKTPTDTSYFTFDISWVGAARGEYLLADSSHGRPSSDNQGGVLSGATDGDVLLIDVDNPGNGAIPILPPQNDPFAGRRCDNNTNFGGVVGTPSRNEISGPNGLFTVNDTEVWVGDGPSRFNPGQSLSGTGAATDYKEDRCDSSVRVFSLLTRRQTDHINVHGCFRTDEGAFDPVEQVVLFANPSENPLVAAKDMHARQVDNSPFITLISAQPTGSDNDDHGDYDDRGDRDHQGHHAILKQINFDGTNHTIDARNIGIEQAVYVRQTGLFYIAIPGPGSSGSLAVVDPRPGPNQFTVVKNIPLTGCAPTGAALGPNETLILGCGDQVYNIVTGALTPISDSLISLACDEVAYDGSSHFASACLTKQSAGNFDLLVSDAHTLNFDTRFSGAPGAHSVAGDPASARFWFPAYGGVCGANQACVAVLGGDDTDAQGP